MLLLVIIEKVLTNQLIPLSILYQSQYTPIPSYSNQVTHVSHGNFLATAPASTGAVVFLSAIPIAKIYGFSIAIVLCAG
jgi:hypothetical protein